MQANPDQIHGLSAFQELVQRDLLTIAFEKGPTQVFVIDAVTMRFVAANAAARRKINVSMPHLRNLQPHHLFTGTDPQRFARLFARLQRRKSRAVAVRIRPATGDRAALDVSLFYSDGMPSSYVVFVSDGPASATRSDRANLTLQSALDAMSEGFVLYDAQDRLVACNTRYRDLFGLTPEEAESGTRFEDILRKGLKRGAYADAIGREADWLSARLSAHLLAQEEIEQQLSNGRWLRIVDRATADGGRVGLRLDITLLKQHEKALHHLLRHDELTGMLNRRGLNDHIATLLPDLRPDQRMVMFQIDLDRFKVINDLWGHDAGDVVLCNAASLVMRSPLGPAISARVAGDEFVMILCTSRSDEELLVDARGLIAVLSEPILHAGQTLAVGATIGISALRPEREDPVRDMISGADIAQNVAKQSGGNDAAIFHDLMREENQRNHKMAEQIHLGLKRDEFVPFFQPQVDTQTGDIIGFEALIRWNHPVRGLVPAFEFLEIAQKSGMTEALDDIVMDRSCHAARQLLDWGMMMPRISINLSLLQISDPRILDRLRIHMQRHDVSSQNLRVELLESTLLDKRATQIMRNVQDLIDAGFPVELDDFGTGHAAIATLRKFAVSRIKIDRSLVQKIDSDPELQVITAAIINLANQLGIDVLAEGVETLNEQKMLVQMGCHRVQGYLHARPMPLEKLHAFLQERRQVA